MRCGSIATLIVLGVSVLINIAEADEARILRFPDIHGDDICFSHGGDLWVVSSQGGAARKITNSEGLELFPKFSPDGSRIAFTGQYDGDLSVYVMPTEGGEPKRLSYRPGYPRVAERHGPENIVTGWTPSGSHILYRSRAEAHDLWDGKLYLASPDGGLPQPLPLPRGGFASFNADRTKLAYCPIFRDFRTWKRYKGGMAQDVWIYDFAARKSEKITDWEGSDNLPMWDHASGKIYFNSDRTGTLNLFVYDPATKSTEQVTHFTEFDVRWPSIGPGAIVFENGGYLYVLDPPAGEPRKITVQLGSDRILARPKWVKVKDRVQNWDLSPDAKRAVFTARGDIFTVPAEHGETRNLTASCGANDKNPTISPDGKWIAYVSDASGEDELYLVAPGGDGAPKRLTSDGDRFYYQPAWSPDSKHLMWTDKSGRLHLVQVGTGKRTLVDSSDDGRIGGYVWSPDSKWIAYSKNNEHFISVIYVYSVTDKSIRPVTDGAFDDYSPTFDPEGKHLYFISDRSFNPMFGDYEFDYVVNKTARIMAIVLSADDPSPV